VILKKALIYKEWQNIRWIAILMFFNMLVFSTPLLVNNMPMSVLLIKADVFNISFSLMLLALAYMLIKDERNEVSYKNLASMPFTRNEIILNKLFAGVTAIVLQIFLNYLISILYFFIGSHSPLGNFSYNNLFFKFLVGTIFYLCIFSFFMLIQSITANSIFGMAAGAIMFFDMSGFSPISFVYITCRLLYCNFKLKLFCLPDKAQKVSALFNYRNVSAENYQDLLKFTIITLIFAVIIILTFKKNKFENIGNITMFRWTEVLLKIYVSIYFSSVLAIILGNMISKNNYLLTDMFFILLFVFWYIVFTKAFQGNTYSKSYVKKRLEL
jgi:ABC-type transport system involved in multi-copper enzyme maturation permease subunit